MWAGVCACACIRKRFSQRVSEWASERASKYMVCSFIYLLSEYGITRENVILTRCANVHILGTKASKSGCIFASTAEYLLTCFDALNATQQPDHITQITSDFRKVVMTSLQSPCRLKSRTCEAATAGGCFASVR